MTAYVMIETAVGKTKAVATKLAKTKGVCCATPVVGPYDIIACIEAEDVNALGSLVCSKIHTIPGVTKTLTCIAVGL